MKYRPLIQFNNDEKIVGREHSVLLEALNELHTLGKDIGYDPEDVQFWQVEPIA